MNYKSKDAQDWAAELRKGNRNKNKDRSAEMCDQLAILLRSMEEAKAVAGIAEPVDFLAINSDNRVLAEDIAWGKQFEHPTSKENGWSVSWLFTHQPAESGEAKDAARYRYIRESGSEFVHYIGGGSHGIYEESRLDGLVDAAIDEEIRFKAAMTAESREKES